MAVATAPHYNYLEAPSVTARDIASTYWKDDFRFRGLVRRWLEENRFASAPRVIRKSSSHRQIVAMGWYAVPLIVADLKQRPSLLFIALEDITGDDPVRDDVRGDVSAMVQDWIAWHQK